MREITEKLHSKAVDSFLPVIEQMAAQGCTKGQIVSAYNTHIRTKVSHYYREGNFLKAFRDCFDLGNFQKADSKIEMLFFEQLQRAGISFTFQHVIGPYRADYLVNGFLVVEIDGPNHNKDHDEKRDKYLRKMGYKIIRIPTWVLVSCPDAAIQEIKGLSSMVARGSP